MASAVDTAVIVVMGVFFLGMGVYALVAPAMLVRPFGITLEHPTSRSEVRAVYGGFGLAIAAVLAYAAVAAGPHRTGILLAVGMALAGMAFGRLVSAVVDGRATYALLFTAGPRFARCLPIRLAESRRTD